MKTILLEHFGHFWFCKNRVFKKIFLLEHFGHFCHWKNRVYQKIFLLEHFGHFCHWKIKVNKKIILLEHFGHFWFCKNRVNKKIFLLKHFDHFCHWKIKVNIFFYLCTLVTLVTEKSKSKRNYFCLITLLLLSLKKERQGKKICPSNLLEHFGHFGKQEFESQK